MNIDWDHFGDSMNELQEAAESKNASYSINWNKDTRLHSVYIFTGKMPTGEDCHVFENKERFGIALAEAIDYLRNLK